MLFQPGCFRGGLVVLSLSLCAIAARGDDVMIKNGTRLVESDFARNWGEDDDAEEQIPNKLRERVDADISLTLSKFVKWLEQTHNLPVELDLEAFAEANLALDAKVKVKGRNLRLETVLNRALRSLNGSVGVSWSIDSGVLQISPHTNELLENRVYSVQKLLDSGFEHAQVVELLTNQTSGPWMKTDDDGGTITSLPRGRILIRQTQRIHFEVARLIRRLQELD